jgi:hypothetical protein
VVDTAPYLLFLNPFASNGPELDDRILYAADAGPAMLDLIADMPDRTPYLQRGSVASQELGPREEPYDLHVSVQPIEVHRGETLNLSVTIVAPEDASHASIRIQTGEADLRYTRALTALPGPLVEEHVVAQEADARSLLVGDRGAVTVTVGFGATAHAAEAAPRLRQQLQYRVVDGAIEALLPATAYRYERVGDDRQWRHAVDLAELQVALR